MQLSVRSLVHTPLPLLIALQLVAAQAGPTVSFLQAERFALRAGEPVELSVASERSGERARAVWPEEDLTWFFVRQDGTQRNADTLPRPESAARRVSVPLARLGPAALGIELRPRVESVSAGELVRFLERRVGPRGARSGLRGLAPDRELRVRRVESAKILVRSFGDEGEGAGDPAVATGKLGQRSELRPVADPTALPVGSDLPLRVYLPYASGAGTRVTATNRAAGVEHNFLTGPGATGFFPVSAPGVWELEAHHARPLAGDPAADWEIHTATLVFEVDGRAAEGNGR